VLSNGPKTCYVRYVHDKLGPWPLTPTTRPMKEKVNTYGPLNSDGTLKLRASFFFLTRAGQYSFFFDTSWAILTMVASVLLPRSIRCSFFSRMASDHYSFFFFFANETFIIRPQKIKCSMQIRNKYSQVIPLKF
jgi:hypothetical protein